MLSRFSVLDLSHTGMRTHLPSASGSFLVYVFQINFAQRFYHIITRPFNGLCIFSMLMLCAPGVCSNWGLSAPANTPSVFSENCSFSKRHHTYYFISQPVGYEIVGNFQVICNLAGVIYCPDGAIVPGQWPGPPTLCGPPAPTPGGKCGSSALLQCDTYVMFKMRLEVTSVILSRLSNVY